MKIQRTLLPGKPGTKRFVEQYDGDLVCVRYRYDEKNEERFTTVEIVVDRQKWKSNESSIPPSKIMNIKIEYGEKELAQQVKSLGGRWDRKQRAWKLPFKYVQILQLENRIKK